ncbi:CopD family protein [Mycolicibacterium sediminis]|uniref:Copper resistance protein D n=1 Tax=Mycolicibacterium sediminis TaxID=1286180 RepID=A0A7I7QL35_9MYCO|nr:CopD family protein [Mycolicibacterium sediminis]BBY26586.1 copper resistance protein D [Mycolicibacterium sediminis]
MTRWRTLVGGGLVVAISAVLAWALAFPQNPLTDSAIRAVADCVAVVTFGLAVVPWLDVERHRGELAARATPPLIGVAALWAVVEFVRLPLSAADAAGVPVPRIGAQTTYEFATATAAGRAGLVCAIAAVVVCVAAAVGSRVSAAGVVAAGAAAVGITGRTLVGHLSEDPLGGVAVAVHALAAALWCGALAALVLTVHHRGRWARVLPRFSRMSLVCVVVLVVAGVAGAFVAVDSVADLWVTGYGRLLLAKTALTFALVALAWRNRTWWLPAARTHRATAEVSLTRSRIELAGMAVTVTLAAALAVTG